MLFCLLLVPLGAVILRFQNVACTIKYSSHILGSVEGRLMCQGTGNTFYNTTIPFKTIWCVHITSSSGRSHSLLGDQPRKKLFPAAYHCRGIRTCVQVHILETWHGTWRRRDAYCSHGTCWLLKASMSLFTCYSMSWESQRALVSRKKHQDATNDLLYFHNL